MIDPYTVRNHFTHCIYEYTTKGSLANYTYVDTNNNPCSYKNHFYW